MELIDIIGKPYRLNGNPPESFDCWQLIKFYRKEFLGKQTDIVKEPDVYPKSEDTMDDHFNTFSDEWERLPRILDGCVLLLGTRGRIEHCGVAVGHRVIHAQRTLLGGGGQVCLHPFGTIKRAFTRIEFWERIDA